jgi:hypothetical protein
MTDYKGLPSVKVKDFEDYVRNFFTIPLVIRFFKDLDRSGGSVSVGGRLIP